MNWIKIKIRILPTKDRTNVLLNKYIMVGSQIEPYSVTQQLHKEEPNEGLELRGYEHQHLYFLSDEEIKEGDWYIDLTYQMVVNEKEGNICSNCKKIIATTDPKLCQPITKAQYEEIRISRNKLRDLYESSMQRNTYLDQIKKLDIQLSSYEKKLPQPSLDFIKEYCDAGGIDEVMVALDERFVYYKIKIHPFDNTINIRNIKDSWSREEVKTKMWFAIVQAQIAKKSMIDAIDELPEWFENWIKDNL